MKVRELIEELSKLDQDKDILVNVLGDLDLDIEIRPIQYYLHPQHPELGTYEFEEWMREPEQAAWLFDKGEIPKVVDAYLIH